MDMVQGCNSKGPLHAIREADPEKVPNWGVYDPDEGPCGDRIATLTDDGTPTPDSSPIPSAYSSASAGI
ncbi:hypothetical protein GCM10009006_35810 [Haloarcula argentinensis]|uniref:Uncharacterized protein n=1 Tax=Haloarcula argentinensis TaxID=43776 RepID=A0A830FHT4_HALAR|nr:hypothetical protein GCM10009006_35810 [Haloarcula argentinensis]